ncbi:hypothetical protein ID866_3604 [Astraeus odoratus]|nr:hypothetical protein ID866_3604 [Astraeus odoratus]
MVNLKRALTALSFNAEGAAIYLGTEKGTLLTLDLRALEKEPIAIVVGDGDSPVRAINVQKKSKNTTVKSRHSTASTTPISGLPSCPARTRSPAKPLPGTSPARSRRQEGTISMGVRSPVRAPVSSRPRRSVIAPKKGSSSKLLSPARSPLKENGNLDTGKRGNFAAALTAQSQDINGTVDLANDDGLPSSSPAEIEDGIVRAGDPSSSDLPRQPTTPICPEKNMKGGIGPQAQIGTPELNAWVKGNKGKDKEVRRARFLRHPGESDEDSGGDAGPTHAIGSKECKEELTLQLSPRRPTTAPSWMPSPQTQSAGNLNMNTAAQDFLRNIVRDVMYEFQRETKAEMTGIHLDLVRMGRVWRRELREAMEEWGEEVRQLHEENKRLREENESLRRRL